MLKMFSRLGMVSLVLVGFTLAACGGSAGQRYTGASGKNTAGIGVNSFFWRGALETLNFMPLASADPYGGVIITGWHSDPSALNERFKATVYILDTRLRADGLKVAVFKEVQNDKGQWVTGTVDPDTEIQIENSILTRARELRIRTLR